MKNQIQTPFSLMDKLFSPYSFSHTSKATLSDKLELYFHDFSSMPLFVAENYLKHKFARAQNVTGRDYDLKRAELLFKAADSISEGDLMDSMIHGSIHTSLELYPCV